MIPAEHREDIIQSGINFIRSITEAYGTDEGMRLWSTIADTIDPEIKGQIFFAMLTGEYNSTITISSCASGANRVALIKAIRSVDTRRLGLKEAKDLSDELSSGKVIRLEVEPSNRNSAIVELRKAGFNV